MTLTEFIAVRLDEDEAAARAISPSGRYLAWKVRMETIDGDVCSRIVSGAGGAVMAEGFVSEPGTGPAVAGHIARHDPVRVLRDVEAKQKMLAEIVPLIDGMDQQIAAEWGAYDEPGLGESTALLKLLALPWSDHPDYDPAWRL